VSPVSEVTFSGPPPAANRKLGEGKHFRAAAELRAEPGYWAVIGTYSTNPSARTAASNIRCAYAGESRVSPSAWEPAGAYEAEARTVDGEHRVYARYVGTPDD